MPTSMSVIQRVMESLAGGLTEEGDLEERFFDNYLPRQSEAARQLIFDFLVAAETLEFGQVDVAITRLKQSLDEKDGALLAPVSGLAQGAAFSAGAPRNRSL